MSFPAMSSASSVVQPYRTCVQYNQADLLGSARTTPLDSPFSSVSLPLSHPLFSSDDVDVLAPISHPKGGIPLRTWYSDDNVTFVALASGEDLHLEQFEVIWQFKLFAQNKDSAMISQTTRADILTLGGTANAPERVVDQHTEEEHFLGWTDEHFKKFFVEYSRNSVKQARNNAMYNAVKNWQDLQMPRWFTSAELLSLSPESSAIMRRVLVPHARIFPRSACRPNDVYTQKPWYHAAKGANHHKERARQNQKRSVLPPTNTQFGRKRLSKGPITSLRETNGLGAAISKTTKPYRCISAQFKDRKLPTGPAPLTQPVRDFIAQKIEEQMLVPAQKEAILHIIRTVSPLEFARRRNGKLIDWRNMGDRLYRELARLFPDSSNVTDPTTNLDNPRNLLDDDARRRLRLTPQMVRFTRENIAKLPAKRLKQLAHIIAGTVPSLDALPPNARHAVKLQELPEQNQILVWKYVLSQFPKEWKKEMERTSRDEAGMEDPETGERKDGDGKIANEGQAAGTSSGGASIDVDEEDDFEIDLDVDFDD